MKQTLLALVLASFFLAACGGPGGQALPVTEQENFEKAIAEAEAQKNNE